MYTSKIRVTKKQSSTRSRESINNHPIYYESHVKMINSADKVVVISV